VVLFLRRFCFRPDMDFSHAATRSAVPMIAYIVRSPFLCAQSGGEAPLPRGLGGAVLLDFFPLMVDFFRMLD